MLFWLEQCRKVYNYALRERKDWINSRKCAVNACSLSQEYIIPADVLYPDYYTQKKALTQAKKDLPDLQRVDAQVLQDTLKRLDRSFKFMKERQFGFPRFKKFGQIRSVVFPQFKASPLRGTQIKLPKVGLMPINLHRPVPEGFDIKQVRVVRKASGWYAQLILQCDVLVPDILPHGEAIGIDLGLEKFLAVSTGQLIQRPRFL
nr:transposase [Phormidesmis priestleyi]